MIQYGVVLFHTTSSVMKAEKAMQKNGFRIKLIPVPREFSSDCGIALRFEWPDYEQVRALLGKNKVEFDAIHLLSKQ